MALPQGPHREEGRAKQRTPRACRGRLPQRAAIPAGDVPRACQANPTDRRRRGRRHGLDRRQLRMGTLPPRRGRGPGRPRPVRPCGDGGPARPQDRRHGVGVAVARRLRTRAGGAGAAARRGRLAAERRDPRAEAAVVVQPQPPPGRRLVDRPHRQGGLAGRGRRDRPGPARPGPRDLLRLQRGHDDPPQRAAPGGRLRRAHAGLPRRSRPVLADAPAGRPGAGGAGCQGAPLRGGHLARPQGPRRQPPEVPDRAPHHGGAAEVDLAAAAAVDVPAGDPRRRAAGAGARAHRPPGRRPPDPVGLGLEREGAAGHDRAPAATAAPPEGRRRRPRQPAGTRRPTAARAAARDARAGLRRSRRARGADAQRRRGPGHARARCPDRAGHRQPSGGEDFLREFGAAFHQGGLGSTDSASPSLALLGGLATITLDKALLAQKLLLWLALPLGAATCTRALRVLVPSLAARAVAGLLYAGSPLAIGALAQGRLGELAFLVLAPPVLAQVVLAFRSQQPREPWRPALRFLVLGAVAIAMYPPAAVVLLVVVAVAVVAALALGPGDDRGLAVRRSVLLGAGFVGALVLQFPFTGQILTGAALRTTGTALASPGFGDLLQLRPGGPGLPGGAVGTLIGPLYPALALAALFFVPAGYRRQTFFLLAGMIAACVAATLQAHGVSPKIVTEWPAGVLVPGAVCWAAATGLALAGLGAALGHGGGLRRATAALLALLALASSVLIAGVLVRGSWSPIRSVGSPSLPATVRQSQGRVLWLAGRTDHGVDFAVTGSSGRTVLDSGRLGDDRARRALQSVVTDIVEARTHEAGSMLQLFGVGYVAIRPGPEAERLVDLVARQQELRTRPTDQAGLFQGPVTQPSAWIVQGEPPAEVRGVITGPALVRVQGVDALFSSPRGAKLPARAIAQVQGASATLAEGTDGAATTAEAAGSGAATLVLPVPADRAWRASVGDTALEPTTVFGWAQGFKLPAGTSGGAVEVRRNGQQRRMVFLLVEALLVLTALATMARPTKVAPPVTPMALDDTTTTDLRLATLARGGAR